MARNPARGRRTSIGCGTFVAPSAHGRDIVRAMSAVPGQPPQRICPKCSTVARTVDAHCPFCGSSYRRRSPWLGVAFATLLVTAAILVGVLAMFVEFGGSGPGQWGIGSGTDRQAVGRAVLPPDA